MGRKRISETSQMKPKPHGNTIEPLSNIMAALRGSTFKSNSPAKTAKGYTPFSIALRCARCSLRRSASYIRRLTWTSRLLDQRCRALSQEKASKQRRRV